MFTGYIPGQLIDPDTGKIEFWTSLRYSTRPCLERVKRKGVRKEEQRTRRKEKEKERLMGLPMATVGLLLITGETLTQA